MGLAYLKKKSKASPATRSLSIFAEAQYTLSLVPRLSWIVSFCPARSDSWDWIRRCDEMEGWNHWLCSEGPIVRYIRPGGAGNAGVRRNTRVLTTYVGEDSDTKGKRQGRSLENLLFLAVQRGVRCKIPWNSCLA